MKIAAVRIFVEDIAAADEFYSGLLGFDAHDRSDEYVMYRAGAMLLIEKAGDEARDAGLLGRFVGVSFESPDLDALHLRLTLAGCPIAGAPELQPWGGRLMHVSDPSGNIVTFVQLP